MNKATLPPKPYADFPLFAHTNGQWRKDIWNGKTKKAVPYYFGPWADDQKGERALKEWVARKDAIKAGLDKVITNAAAAGTLTLGELIKDFMQTRHDKLLKGMLADETFMDYDKELTAFGNWSNLASAKAAALGPDHFTAYFRHLSTPAGRNLGVDRLASVIRYIRALFNYGAKNGKIPPVIFGTEFVPPATDRESKALVAGRNGDDNEEEATFSAAQVKWLLDRSTPLFKAMILMALNCGLGPTDLARVKWKYINFGTGRLSGPRRGKKGIRRESYLWPETRAALRRVQTLTHNAAAIAKDGENALVFVTRKGESVVRKVRVMKEGRVVKIKFSNAISGTFSKWIAEGRKAGVFKKDVKLTFYNLRHTFRTHADNAPDMNAVRRIMGRKMLGMDHRYVHGRFKLRRLKKVARLVHRYIFPRPKQPKTTHGTPGLRIVGGEVAAA